MKSNNPLEQWFLDLFFTCVPVRNGEEYLAYQQLAIAKIKV